MTRVRIDGIIELKLRQGPTAALVINGQRRWLATTVTQQRGETLFIGSEIKEIRLTQQDRAVQAELTLPQLRQVISNSLGTTDISGFTGERLDLVLDGAGSMKVAGSYRVISASLGGLGSMNIQAALSDGLELNLHGAGYVTATGSARWLRADLGGLGGLDAQHFQVDSVQLDLGGLGNAAVYARQQAALQLHGLGSAAVYGRPGRAQRACRRPGQGDLEMRLATPFTSRRSSLLALLLPLALAAHLPAHAGAFADAASAYKQGQYALALKRVTPLAASGHADAQHLLGLMYYMGRGVARDYRQAMTWHRKAAEQGKADAQYVVGAMYYTGNGVVQDHRQAVPWFRKAAEQGHAEAQHALGLMYRYHVAGMPQDMVLAYMLWNLAATSGHANAAQQRAAIVEKMTAEQIDEGQALSRVWRPGTPLPASTRTGRAKGEQSSVQG